LTKTELYKDKKELYWVKIDLQASVIVSQVDKWLN